MRIFWRPPLLSLQSTICWRGVSSSDSGADVGVGREVGALVGVGLLVGAEVAVAEGTAVAAGVTVAPWGSAASSVSVDTGVSVAASVAVASGLSPEAGSLDELREGDWVGVTDMEVSITVGGGVSEERGVEVGSDPPAGREVTVRAGVSVLGAANVAVIVDTGIHPTSTSPITIIQVNWARCSRWGALSVLVFMGLMSNQ